MKNGIRIGVVALLCGAVWACGDTEAAENVAIQTVTVGRGNLRIAAEATGAIEPVRRVEVKSKASGEILRLYVDVGDVVEPGSLLVEIDPRDVRNSHEQATADLSVSEAQAENARSQLARQQELHAAGVITDQELESARLQATNTQANLTRARTNLELARLRLEDVTIRAPMSGTILQKNVEVGTVIQSASGSVSGGTALFVMASLDQMQVRVLIDETDIGLLRPNLPVTITVQAYPDRRFNGVLELIQPQAQVQQNVTKFPAIISLENLEGLLRPGMNADVQILIDEARDVLLLDAMAFVGMDDVLPAARALGLEDSSVEGLTGGGGGGGGAGGNAGRQATDGEAGGRANAEAAGGGAGEQRQAAAGAGGQGRGGREGAEGVGEGRGQAAAPAGGAAAGQNENRSSIRLGAVQGRGGRGGGRGGRGQGESSIRPITRVAVFVMDDAGTLTPRAVTIGLSDFERAEVISGLEEGDRVALVGAAQLAAQQQQQQLQGRGGLQMFGAPIPGGGRGFGGGGPGGGGGGGGGGRGGN